MRQLEVSHQEAPETAGAPPSRREARRQSRREAILDVAEATFLELGYAGTTMTAIASTLGGSKGTLWSHFPSKEELFAAVLDRAIAEFRARLASVLNAGDKLDAVLADFCKQFLAKVVSPEAVALNRLVVAEAGRFPEMAKIFWERGPRETHQLLAAYLGNAMERGLLRRDDPLRAGRHLTSLCMSGCHQHMLMGTLEAAGPAEIEEDAAAAVAVFLRAYAA